jgi:hypothetical protein
MRVRETLDVLAERLQTTGCGPSLGNRFRPKAAPSPAARVAYGFGSTRADESFFRGCEPERNPGRTASLGAQARPPAPSIAPDNSQKLQAIFDCM